MAEWVLLAGFLLFCFCGCVCVIAMLTFALRCLEAFPRGAEGAPAPPGPSEVYPVRSIEEEGPEAVAMEDVYRLSRHAATPEEIIAGIIREEQSRER